jgi:hypothetical protein
LAAAFASVPEPGMALTMLEIWASGGLLGRRRRRMALLQECQIRLSLFEIYLVEIFTLPVSFQTLSVLR